MKIRQIEINNFKSFNNITVALGDMNVLIGPNASGKSNFLDSFLFIKDCLEKGIENACLQRGDIDNILNKRTNKETLSFNISVDFSTVAYESFLYEKSLYLFRPTSFEYFFELQKTTRAPRVRDEKLTYTYNFVCANPRQLTFLENSGFIRLKALNRPHFYVPTKIRKIINTNIEKIISLPDTKQFKVDLSVISANKLTVRNLTEIDDPGINKAIIFWAKQMDLFVYSGDTKKGVQLRAEDLVIRRTASPIAVFSKLVSYDIDPKLVKESSPVTTLNQLASRGENLAPLIKYIYTKDKGLLREVYSILSTIIPFFEKFTVSYTDEKKLILKLKELGIKRPFPAYLMSDGTANITALLIALLYNDDKTLICIEEPEKDVHPLVLAKLVEVFRDMSAKRQIIITSHSPDLVRNLMPKEVYLIDRGDTGFTRIVRANENKEIDSFLQNFSLDELWLSGYLSRESSKHQ